MFLVDALDRDRFQESRKELNDLLSDEALMHVSPAEALAGWLAVLQRRIRQTAPLTLCLLAPEQVASHRI